MSSQSGFYFTTPISNDRSGEAAAQHHIHRQTAAQGRVGQTASSGRGGLRKFAAPAMTHCQIYESSCSF